MTESFCVDYHAANFIAGFDDSAIEIRLWECAQTRDLEEYVRFAPSYVRNDALCIENESVEDTQSKSKKLVFFSKRCTKSLIRVPNLSLGLV